MIQLPLEELKKNLVDSGLVRQADFDAALEDAKRAGQNAVDIMISRRYLDEDYYINLLSQYFSIPRADSVAPRRIPQEILHLIPQDIARQKRALVFSKEADGTFNVAMENPNDLEAAAFLEKYLRGKIKPFIATERFLNQGYALYSQISTENFIQVIQENIKESERQRLRGTQDAAEEVPIVAIVDNFVAYAIALGASDIHIESLEDIVLVRFRVDGILREIIRISTTVHPAVVARIKLLSGLKIDEHSKPQDGRFRYKVLNDMVDVRVSIMPTFHGEKIVMRLLRATAKPMSLADLGMLGDTGVMIQDALAKTFGIILITGPTGSGKTTTIYSMVDILNRPEVNIVTVEDPVEYDMRYVNQTQVNPVAGITFASALRAFLRQDPNIILVGEIRDAETADIAVNAALTGHLVLASLHTNDAPTSIPRLIDMGVPPFLVAAVVNIIMAQRLVRRVCAECIESYTPADAVMIAVREQLEMASITTELSKSHFRGRGCYACNMTGYRGRLAIYEVAHIDTEIRNFISGRDFTLDRLKEKLRTKGMKTMLEDGLRKAGQGMTTLEEVLRVARE